MNNYYIYLINKNNLEDIKYIIGNIKNLFTLTWNKNQFLNQINSDNNITYILKSDNYIIGFICLKSCLDEAEILNISIDKNYRNKGLGNYLLKKVLNLLKEKKFIKVFLEVNINNKFAINLYKNNNFETISTRKDYYLNKTNNTKEDAYIMAKKL